MDKISREQRSKNMSRIRSKNTSLEIKVRKYLFHHGFRYRINVKGLPGTPDIVLNKYKTIIFVNGCFWHRHINCKYATIPKSNTEYWFQKFKYNIEKDNLNQCLLKQSGWHVMILWECDLKNNFNEIMNEVIETIR